MNETTEKKLRKILFDFFELFLILLAVALFISSFILRKKAEGLSEFYKVEAELKCITMHSIAWAVLIVGGILAVSTLVEKSITKKTSNTTPIVDKKQVIGKTENTTKKIFYQQLSNKSVPSIKEPKNNWICPQCGESNNPLATNCINCFCEKPNK